MYLGVRVCVFINNIIFFYKPNLCVLIMFAAEIYHYFVLQYTFHRLLSKEQVTFFCICWLSILSICGWSPYFECCGLLAVKIVKHCCRHYLVVLACRQ